MIKDKILQIIPGKQAFVSEAAGDVGFSHQ
jgi:hypothetical protein